MPKREPSVLGAVAAGSSLTLINVGLVAAALFGVVGIAAVAGGGIVLSAVGDAARRKRKKPTASGLSSGARAAVRRGTAGGRSVGKTRSGDPLQRSTRGAAPRKSSSGKTGKFRGLAARPGGTAKTKPLTALGGAAKKTTRRTPGATKGSPSSSNGKRTLTKGIGRIRNVPKPKKGAATPFTTGMRHKTKKTMRTLKKMARKAAATSMARFWLTKEQQPETLTRQPPPKTVSKPSHTAAVPAKTIPVPTRIPVPQTGRKQTMTDHKEAIHSGRPSMLPQTVAALRQELGRVLIDRNSGGLTILNINESVAELLTELAQGMMHVRGQLIDAKPNERMIHDFYSTAGASMHGNATWFVASAQGYAAAKYPEILHAKSGDTTWDASTNLQAGV